MRASIGIGGVGGMSDPIFSITLLVCDTSLLIIIIYPPNVALNNNHKWVVDFQLTAGAIGPL